MRGMNFEVLAASGVLVFRYVFGDLHDWKPARWHEAEA